MQRIIIFLLLFTFSCQSSKAQEVPLSEGGSILFKNVKSMTSNAEKNEIFDLTEFQLTTDKAQFIFSNNESLSDFPFSVSVFPLDLDNDGVEEIGIVYGNIMTSGNAGNSSMLFIKKDLDNYTSHLGFPGFLTFLPRPDNDFPDVLIGGSGFKFPVWRWDGVEFSHHKTISNDELNNLDSIHMTEASKQYTGQLKDD